MCLHRQRDYSLLFCTAPFITRSIVNLESLHHCITLKGKKRNKIPITIFSIQQENISDRFQVIELLKLKKKSK